MELERIPRHLQRPRKRRSPIIIFLLLFFLSAATTVYILWDKYYPNQERISADFNGLAKPIFYNGELMEQSAQGKKETLKLPLTFIKEFIDPHILYEEQSHSVIITTTEKVVRLKTSQLTGFINEAPFELRFPVEKLEEEIYLPIAPLQELYAIELRESEETGAVIMVKEGDHLQWGRAITMPNKPERTIAIRTEPTIKAPIVTDLYQNEEVILWSEENGWYRVQLMNGIIGFAPKDRIVLDRIETIPHRPIQQAFVPWKPLGGKINLTWEQVVTKNPDTSKIGPMPGLNIVSPTWFELMDGEGNLKNLASTEYVKWAHSQGYQVWALFSNGFEPNRTTAALSTYDTRMKMIKQLVSFAQLYGLQGINIDFENVYTKDKQNLTQFVREMTPILHEQGLVVSIDVTPKSNSEMWSVFYDREALAQTVDYMMVMAYDEHWAASPIAGSVSSLPWVEKSITRILEEDKVPPHKLVLSVPFYTRIWTEEMKDGQKKVSSRAVFMNTPNQTIKEKNLKPVFLEEIGQHYVEYREGDKLIRIWLEDEVSMKLRMDLVKKYDLAGVASWRRGYEPPEIWTVIQEALAKKP